MAVNLLCLAMSEPCHTVPINGPKLLFENNNQRHKLTFSKVGFSPLFEADILI